MFNARESPAPIPPQFFVEPKRVQTQRAEFAQALRRAGKDNRQIVETYLPVIGANGVLDGIQAVWPKCHSEAHDLGKVLFSRTRDVGTSLRVCADRCYSGCMHGVLMESFTGAGKGDAHHLDLVALTPMMKDLCRANLVMTASYSPGDCAHGVGHALMYSAAYRIPQAIEACAGFGAAAMEYYCATGAYMEYVTEKDEEDAATKSVLYPCDTYAYPAACARFKMVHVTRRHYAAGKAPEALRQQCEALSGAVRLGCFHGLGNAHMPIIAVGLISMREVCLNLTEAEEFVCIEGVMERMAKFHEERAKQVCRELSGRSQKTCLAAVAHKLYNMEKDFSVYLAK